MHNALDIALLAAEAADRKKGIDIQVLDLRELTTIADYFVICTGMSTTQVGAIADEVGLRLASAGEHPSHIEGASGATWILMDYGDVVVHIFEEQTRAYYGLERLWGDAPRVEVTCPSPGLHGIPS
jgi:ribosome-associated protein